jgi:Arc/MetJ-type ribon-helix-helix transcriptional regulator
MTQVALQIPDDLKPFIDHSVKSGLFSDAADFLVNLLYNEKAESESVSEREVSEKLTRLRAEVNIGIDQLRNGQCAEFDADDIIQRGKARLAAKAQMHE